MKNPFSRRKQYFAHRTATIDKGAKIGSGTKIWHYSHIMPGAVIGKNCTIGQNVFIADGVQIGRGCKIQNNVSIYEGVKIGSYVFLGPSCVFTNVRKPRANRSATAYDEIKVGHGVTIGANATIIAPCLVGAWAFIGAGAVVTKHVPDHSLAIGNPAKLEKIQDNTGGLL